VCLAKTLDRKIGMVPWKMEKTAWRLQPRSCAAVSLSCWQLSAANFHGMMSKKWASVVCTECQVDNVVMATGFSLEHDPGAAQGRDTSLACAVNTAAAPVR
jgi:hypothetical protein